MEQISTIDTVEAFAHCLRGITALFFFYWSYRLYLYKGRLEMVRLLYWATLYVACCYVKDGLLMVQEWKNSDFLNNLITVIDLPYVPLTCAFLVDVCYPGWIKRRVVAVVFALQALLIPLYLFYPSEKVCWIAYLLAFSTAGSTLLFVVGYYFRYRYASDASFAQDPFFDVQRVVWFCLLLYGTLVTYYGCLEEPTWGGEVLFNSLSLFLWFFPYRFTLDLLRSMQLDQLVEETSDDASSLEDAAGGFVDRLVLPSPSDATDETVPDGLLTQEQLGQIGELLRHCMEEDRVFLDPKLSLQSLALHVGQNRTYVSYYLNHSLKMTFYEYLNRYRVEEACVRIQDMTQDERKPLVAISQECGFNSFSTFNRAFSKLKGVTPGDYVRQQQARLLREQPSE